MQGISKPQLMRLVEGMPLFPGVPGCEALPRIAVASHAFLGTLTMPVNATQWDTLDYNNCSLKTTYWMTGVCPDAHKCNRLFMHA